VTVRVVWVTVLEIGLVSLFVASMPSGYFPQQARRQASLLFSLQFFSHTFLLHARWHSYLPFKEPAADAES